MDGGFKFQTREHSNKSGEKTRTGSSGDNSFNIGSSEFFQNLNPITKQYLEQIEKAYQQRNDSIESSAKDSKSPKDQAVMMEKYKQMRDTAIDIGQWMKGNGGA